MKTKFLVLVLVIFTFGLYISTTLEAGVLQQIVRKAGKVADDVPLRPMEESAASPATRKMAHELMEKTRTADSAVPYSRALVREIKTASGTIVDPTVLRALDTLDDAGLEVVMLASRGAKNVTTAVPDIARRASFMRQANGDTLCVLGRYDDLAREAYKFQNTLANPKYIPSPEGMRRVTLDDFGAFFQKFGQKGHDFWMNTVKPNWKWWATGTALAVVLLTPEEDLDKAIEAVGWAADKVVDTGVKVVKEAVEVGTDAAEDVLETTGEAAGKTIMSVLRGFFSTWFGACVAIIGGLIGLLWVLSNPFIQKFFRWIARMAASIKKMVCPKRS